MNESLRRALLRARLSEEDVAARLQVDPKTVRRWLEGRVPYPRHRWLLASALGLDEADLWPQLGASRSRPQEVQAVYPHLEDVPRETWLRLFGEAQERIDILAGSALFLATDPAGDGHPGRPSSGRGQGAHLPAGPKYARHRAARVTRHVAQTDSGSPRSVRLVTSWRRCRSSST